MKPSDLFAALPELIASRQSIFIHGKSGIGKSSVIRQFCAANKLQLNDARASQLDSIDIRGFPVPDMKGRKMEWLPANFLPTKDDKPGVLFLDELNGAMPSVASAFYQLILDRRIGEYVFPDHWAIIAAGNGQGDRGITHQMPAPLNNRFLHIDYELDADDWQTRAREDGVHPHIRAYLSLKPSSLHVFDSVTNPQRFPTPRSWYMADQIYRNTNYGPLIRKELISGAIGEGATAEFLGFVATLADMPDISEILSDPAAARVPASQVVMHAVSVTLSDKATPSNFAKLMVYINRLPKEIQMVFVRKCVTANRKLAETSTYVTWALANKSYLG